MRRDEDSFAKLIKEFKAQQVLDALNPEVCNCGEDMVYSSRTSPEWPWVCPACGWYKQRSRGVEFSCPPTKPSRY